MITIYDSRETDFSTLGLCALQPTECTIEGEENGMMELSMTHPMDRDGRWLNLAEYNIIRAPAPVRETPLIRVLDNPGASGKTATRTICKVKTYTGKRLRLRAKPSTSAKVLGYYAPGTEVVRLSVSGDWAQVVIVKGGASGWMSNERLQVVRTETENVSGSGTENVSKCIEPRQTREQLFRICEVETDDEAGLVYVTAKHIFYDLAYNTVKGDYSPDGAAVGEVCAQLLARALDPHDFTVYCTAEGTVTGDYGRKGIANCLLESEIGVADQTGAKIVLDNYDVFVLKDETRDNGVEIRHAKNMTGATLKKNVESTITRIVPVGKDENGDPLPLPNGEYVETPRAASIPVIHSKEIEYDVSVGKNEGEYKDNAAAYAKLRELAAADFADNALDAVTVGLDVDFVILENRHSESYAAYAALQTIHMGDTVRVVSSRSGIDAKLRMTGFTYDAMYPNGGRYKKVRLGQLTDLKTQVYGFDIARGTTPGNKILPNSLDGQAALKNATIGYAKIAQAAIEQLAADSIVAIRADIHEIVAGSVTTDQLYADLARLAVAQITTANIKEANIDWAEIAELTAQIANISKAQITTANINAANINWAQITSLSAAIAEIATAKIGEAEIKSAQITDLEAEVARIAAAKIAVADIDWAHIKDLVAGTAIFTAGVGDKLHIARLAVTEANMVSLSVGELLVKGQDGSFYSVSVDADGNIVTEKKQVVNSDVKDLSINAGEKIIEGTVTAACLNANDIFANNATIRQLIAANIDVDTLFAREATINALNAMDIRGNEYLQLYVTDKVDGISVGGRNYILESGEYDPITGNGGAAQDYYIFKIADAFWSNDERIDSNIVFSFDWEWNTGLPGAMNSLIGFRASPYYNASFQFPAGQKTGHVSLSIDIPTLNYTATHLFVRLVNVSSSYNLTIRNAKLEVGNKATDWSPAPEDPAGSLSVNSDYSKVEITKNQVKIVSREMEVAVPSEDGEDDVLRVDADGVHAEVVEADQIVSDSVVRTQGAANYTPANAGELAAILEELSGKHLTGSVSINCKNVSSGSFSIDRISGGGYVSLNNGTMNALEITNCGASVVVYLSRIAFSTSGTALTISNAHEVYVDSCTFNAGVGVHLGSGWPSQAYMASCAGDCATMAQVALMSRLCICGASKPTGTVSLNYGGEVYNATSDPSFTAKADPSIPSTQTVTASLSPTQTYTLRGTSNSDGNKLYQGRYSSSRPLRKGVMLFSLPSDLTSADKIDSATLTIRRIGGVGQGGGVTVQVRCYDVPGTLYASKTAYDGQTVSIDVTAAVKVMKTSGYTGLMLYNPDTTTAGSKSYTASYARFAGKGESGAPVLKVSYRK